MPLDLTVIILTFNEERHIARALQSVSAIAARVAVVDSFSTDRTVEIASSMGALILQNPFVNQARQFQWGLEHVPTQTAWVMRLDADEVVSSELCAEIAERLPGLAPQVVGVNLKRRHIWMGRWVRHGGRYPLIMLRIWRRGHGRIEDRWMDEHIFVVGGTTITFEHDFADDNLNDLGYFVDKHNRYATREAIEVLCERFALSEHDGALSPQASSRQAAAKRWLKSKVYNRIPFTVSAPAYFVWRYVFRLGFLDGRSGLTYHFLQGCWYRFLVGAKVMELERAVGHLRDRDAIVAELARLTGLRIAR
jgi:glycosyltransferase involved in cell wall biosynthesis